VNAASKKLPAKKRRRNVQSLEHLVSSTGTGVSSEAVVDLERLHPQGPFLFTLRGEISCSSRRFGLNPINAVFTLPSSWMTLSCGSFRTLVWPAEAKQ